MFALINPVVYLIDSNKGTISIVYQVVVQRVRKADHSSIINNISAIIAYLPVQWAILFRISPFVHFYKMPMIVLQLYLFIEINIFILSNIIIPCNYVFTVSPPSPLPASRCIYYFSLPTPFTLFILSNFGPLIMGAISFRITLCDKFSNHTPKTF